LRAYPLPVDKSSPIQDRKELEMKNIIGTIGLASSTSALGGCETGPAAFQARRPGRRCSRLTVFSIPTSGAASSRKNSNSVGMPALNFCTGFSV